MTTFLFFIVFVALIFDFFNGFHDAANSIATAVSTRVLAPAQAVIWAAFFNFVAAFLFGTKVAGTIGKGLIDNAPQYLDVYVVLAGLTGAIIWNVITWLLALPTSSSHALVSAVAGAAIAKGGVGAIIVGKAWGLLLLFIVLSPLIGFLLGGLLMVLMAWTFRRAHPHRIDVAFRRLHLVSAAIYSLGHGGNDAQKTMGIIVLLLSAAGLKDWWMADPNSPLNMINIFGHNHNVAWWIILSC